jgi:NAD/NADP octopine/nopaline dehydrogenase, alpha-helical domain
MRVAVCGGGALATAICAVAGAEPSLDVRVLTRRPSEWRRDVTADALGRQVKGRLGAASDRPEETVAGSDVVVFALPAFAWRPVLERIAVSLSPHAWIVALPGGGGFDETVQSVLPKARYAASRRTPYISHLTAYGAAARIDGISRTVEIAGTPGVAALVQPLQAILSIPVRVVQRFESVTLCPANAVVHPSRLVPLLDEGGEDGLLDRQLGFYRDWNDAASRFALAAGDEVAEIGRALGIDDLPTLREHYGVGCVAQLTTRLRGLASLRNVALPLQRVAGNTNLDFTHRMFREDFGYGLAAIVRLANRAGHPAPTLREMLARGLAKLEPAAVPAR